MIQRMVASALFAGFAAGLFAAALQFAFVEPVLLAGERYEAGELVHAPVAMAGLNHADDDPAAAAAANGQSGADQIAAPAPAIDWPRHGLTVAFTAAVYCGYALILAAAFALAELRGVRVGARAGIVWGLAGFIAVQFAPAAGLPPELPGLAAADLTGRQLWWAGTVIATAFGLWLIAFGKTAPTWALGAILILMPHMIGAPVPVQMSGPVPPELAALFAGRTLSVGMAVWVVLGWLTGGAWDRLRA